MARLASSDPPVATREHGWYALAREPPEASLLLNSQVTTGYTSLASVGRRNHAVVRAEPLAIDGWSLLAVWLSNGTIPLAFRGGLIEAVLTRPLERQHVNIPPPIAGASLKRLDQSARSGRLVIPPLFAGASLKLGDVATAAIVPRHLPPLCAGPH